MILGSVARSFRLALVLALFLSALPALALASSGKDAEPTPDVQEFLKLLGKSDVQQWLNERQHIPAGTGEAGPSAVADSFGEVLSARLKAVRNHILALWQVLPKVGTELQEAARRLREAGGGSGFLSILLIAGLSIGFGLTAQALARNRFQRSPPSLQHEDERLATQRRRRLIRSIVRELAGLLAFYIACFGPLLLFERDRLPDSILLTFLAAFAAWVSVRSVAHVALTPDKIPNTRFSADSSSIGKAEGRRSFFWVVAAAGWFVLGTAITEAMRLSGMDPLMSELVSYILGIGLLAIGLAAIWQAPKIGDAPPQRPADRNVPYRWLATFLLILLWTVWVAGAMRLFWLLVIGLLTPMALGAARKLTRHLLLDDTQASEDRVSPTSIVVVDTLLRALLIGAALSILGWAWEIGFSHLAAPDDPISTVARALITVLAILFAFDVLWQFTRTAIDLKLSRADDTATAAADMGARQARVRTLLPVARNFAMVFFATLAVLMTLSTLGVAIGPLIASAGVAGLAIGFGAQTLVKDVISGIFYLLDDAFRVGEYIESGSFSGTVESFSLRSVRLRHPNGPVFTVPFSALGAVQNGSRDYAVDKFLITVTYDTDLEKAGQLIKQVGEQLMEDPELAPAIIEPLKMQAVGDFGTYGIQLRLKTTTKPGYQTAVRKQAYPLIKKIFEKNGIEFAHPTVKVAEGGSTAKAAAVQHMARTASGKPSA